MAAVKSQFSIACRRYSLTRFHFLRISLLTLTLCMVGTLFVFFYQSHYSILPYKLLMNQQADTRETNYTDIYVYITSHPTSTTSRELENYRISTTEPVNLGQGNNTERNEVKDSCTFPDIDPFHPSVMAVTKFHPPITCKGGVPHLVYMNGDTIQVNHSKTALVGDKNNTFKACTYKTLARKPGSDFETVVLYTSPPFNDSIILRDSDDNLVVECYGNNNTALSRSYFSLIRVKKDLELLLKENFKKHVAKNAPKEVFNVLMIGIDGTSKQNFQRHMPKTRNFLLNVLNATELHKYNKFGDNTFPNVVPLLTGKPTSNLHRHPRYKWTVGKHFDRINNDFLWSDYHKAGYRTGLLLDDHFITAFHVSKRGWNKPPVDYYARATILELRLDKLMKPRGHHCVGDVPEITYNHDFWIQMASTFNNPHTKPFFGYSFSTHLTHDDSNLASAGDDHYLSFFQELRDKNVTNNTVIVFFSDHGARFGAIRKTYNGLIEVRTPCIFLVFPPWFHQKYPDLMKVLKINQERLTTHTDVYATLRNLLNFQAETRLGDINKTGISLFQEIPRERTCEHVGITAQFCACNNFIPTNVSSSTTITLANAIQKHLLKLISAVRNKCRELFVRSVQSVLEVHVDKPDRIKATEAKTLYQITLTTTPGDALYEATVIISNHSNEVEVVGDITRLNLYRGQADCIENLKLKPFCFCKN